MRLGMENLERRDLMSSISLLNTGGAGVPDVQASIGTEVETTSERSFDHLGSDMTRLVDTESVWDDTDIVHVHQTGVGKMSSHFARDAKLDAHACSEPTIRSDEGSESQPLNVLAVDMLNRRDPDREDARQVSLLLPAIQIFTRPEVGEGTPRIILDDHLPPQDWTMPW